METPITDGFDFPCGRPDGQGYYVAAGLCDEAYHKKYGTWHPGEDWNGIGGGDSDLGDAVYAVAHGRVVEAGAFDEWGNVALIEHCLPDGSRVWSQYAHLGKMHIKAGDTVQRGQQIGTIGHMLDSAGQPEGSAHLHFELRCEDLPADVWGMSKADVLRCYKAPSAYIKAHRPVREHLPEYEPAQDVATLAEKARWWLEEAQRRREAGDAARAEAIWRSLIKLLYRVEAAAKGKA